MTKDSLTYNPSPNQGIATENISLAKQPNASIRKSNKHSVSSLSSEKRSDSIAASNLKLNQARLDSIKKDSIENIRPLKGIALCNDIKETQSKTDATSGISWVFAALLTLFCIIAFRFHNNRKFLKSFFRDLTTSNLRANVFDDTVRESSLSWLLFLQWGLSAGIILFFIWQNNIWPFDILNLNRSIEINPLNGCLICSGVTTAYLGITYLLYKICGNVFYNSQLTSQWLKGYVAAQGLCGVIFFILAILMLCYPLWITPLSEAALITFCITKVIFIWKGFRTFYSKPASWILFFYYLCGIELIPIELMFFSISELL